MRENALLNALRLKQMIDGAVVDGGDETSSEQVSRPLPRKVTKEPSLPKNTVNSDSTQVNRSQRTKNVTTSNDKIESDEPVVVSWSTKLQSVRHSNELILHLRADKFAEEDIQISWSTEIATQWSGQGVTVLIAFHFDTVEIQNSGHPK